MPNQLAHFAIHADDLDCARKFYSGVFGWKFQGHGGPLADFGQIEDASGISIHQSLRGFNG
jgi:predicted enzyme related to lactoylglutathione lyase